MSSSTSERERSRRADSTHSQDQSIMADKQADVPPQQTSSEEDHQNPSVDSIVSVSSDNDSDTTVAAANDSAENQPAPANASTTAGATPSAGPAAAGAANDGAQAAADDGAQAASNVSEHPHPILDELLRATAQLAKNMREISQYIIKCHTAVVSVEDLDARIVSASSTNSSLQLISTMLDIHKSVAQDIAADYDSGYFEYIREEIFKYYSLGQIYTSRSRYNIRHTRRRLSRRQRQRRREQQQHPYRAR